MEILVRTGGRLIAFFAITFGITWGLAAAIVLWPPAQAVFGEASLANPLVFVAVYAPSIAAIIVCTATEGRVAVRELLARLFRWRVGVRWYAIVLLGIPALSLGARAIAGAVTGSPPTIHLPFWPGLPAAVLTAVFLDPGPLGEELGWRGYALPRLMVGRSALSAAIILGVIWGVWHLPAFFLSGMPQSGLSLPLFLIGSVELSILMAWVFNRTGGSVMLTILIHLMFNVTGPLAGGATLARISIALLTLVTAIVIVLEGPQDLSRAGRVSLALYDGREPQAA